MGGFATYDKGGGVPGTTVYADNVDFTGGGSRTNTITTDGQLLIGQTAPTVNSNHIVVGHLTSPDSSLTIGYSSPNITLQVTGGGTVGKTITGDTGGPISPVAGNWNIVGGPLSAGTNASTTSGSGNTLTITSINTAKWIVDPNPNRGTHTTIQGAVTSASSGQTIFVRPGTYTENVTLKAGVNICAFPCDANETNFGNTSNVTIVGTLTATFSGSCSLSGLCLQTNSATVLTVSGANATNVFLSGCYINATNNNAILISSSGGSNVVLFQCNGSLQTTGIHYFDVTGSGAVLWIYDGVYANPGNSTSVSTTSGNGGISLRYVELYNAFTTSSTGGLSVDYCTIRNPANVGVIVNSTGTNTIRYTVIESGSATGLIVGAGAVLLADMLTISSTNTNALDGTGEIRYGEIIYTSTSSKNNVTTKTPRTVQEVTSAISQLVYSTTNNVLAGLATANSASLVTTSAGVPVWSSTMTNGQMIIGSTGATPVAGTITSTGGSITITTGAGTLNLEVAGGGLTWVDATGATQALLAQHGYVTDRGGGVTYTLPASGTLGDQIKIVGKLGLATITPNANQQILIGSSSGAVGVTGTATSNNVGDCIELICITAGASTVWRADSVVGTWTLTT